MNNRAFFDAEKAANTQNWKQADGWGGPNIHSPELGKGTRWGSANGEDGWDYVNPPDLGKGTEWGSANGGNAIENNSPTAYIIQVVNSCNGGGEASAGAIANVDIGDAATNRTASNFGQSTNITITSTIPGVSYLEYLATSETSPFTVGLTMIISTSAGQLDQALAITHRNVGGDRQDFVIAPTLSPFQTQTNRLTDDTEYLMDGMSRLRFNQVNSLATVTVRQYMKNRFNPLQIVANRPAVKNYADPNINKLR